jgi:hypothetical protein
MLRNLPSRAGITSTIFAIMSFGSSLPSGLLCYIVRVKQVEFLYA